MLNYGFPDRTYFELFEGTHPSRKIYSVQVKEWEKEFPGAAAVVQVKEQRLNDEIEHLRVEPTADLVEFLGKRGVDVSKDIYIQPLAFAWVSYGDANTGINSNTKMIIAAAIAVLSLLS